MVAQVRMCPLIVAVFLVGLVYLAGHVVAVSVRQQGMPVVREQQQPVCRGLGRREVDWWVMLKHPSGYQYSYLDSAMLDSSSSGGCAGGSCWRHRLSMLNPNPVAHTLAVLAAAAAGPACNQAAAAAAPLAYVIYNDDDPPGTEHFEFAHAKGVAAFSSSSSSHSNGSFEGFWLVHSAPRFPKAPSEPAFSELAKAQSVFGQHFSCFSLAGTQSIAAVADMLLAAGPYVYSSSLPDGLAAAFPAWQRLLSGFNDTQQHSVSVALWTAAGQQLQGFAKTKALHVSLTDQVVGPGLEVTMVWETWRRSHDALASRCADGAGQFSSMNVQQVAFPSTPYTWHWSVDHSKWGISSGSNSSSSTGAHVVCLGDMNRAGWQAYRGGEYVCLQHPGLWQAFSSIVAAVEQCS